MDTSSSIKSTPLQSQTNPDVPVRDPTYFLESFFIQVEDNIFQVPKHHFREAEPFRTAFTLPSQQGTEVEGLSENNPIKLMGIVKSDFQAILKIFYPLQIPHSYANCTLEDWKSALKLSTMWDIQQLRDLTIRQLGAFGMDAVTKIILGKEYHVPEWTLQGCTNLACRNTGLTIEEAEMLGMQVVLRIYEVRDATLLMRTRVPLQECQSAVQRIFHDVL
ncbi:hypothetical protein B0H34DRAFT_381777 [Crassisporium funariophilum]|nr:hypothetical protein B0H34DRAFT_381777 [Crassisporium funariophilum]